MIKGQLTGDRRVVQALRQRVPAITQRVERAIERLTIILTQRVKLKLTDDVLRVRTGRLRRSITFVVTGKGTDKVEGVVGTNVEYARVHELGFNGAVNIKAHLRTIKQAWGKSIQPKQITVSSHSRQVNLPARSFLRSAMNDMRADIIEELTNAARSDQ